MPQNQQVALCAYLRSGCVGDFARAGGDVLAPTRAMAESVELSHQEQEQVAERKHPRAQVLYEAIRTEGEQELERPVRALAWSGLAAGLSMGFSLVAMGLFRAALPDSPWARLVSALGYPVGFLIVIVARQQLFTENSLTPIIPLLQQPSARKALRVLRLWAVVLLANLLGTFAFAFVVQHFSVFSPQMSVAFGELGREALRGGFGSHFLRAIFAGWIIALMMWMLAGADAKVFLVVVMTTIVGAADLSHVVAGSTEVLYAMFAGDASLSDYLVHFLIPTALGNMLGGITLVALLSHAQVAADQNESAANE